MGKKGVALKNLIHIPPIGREFRDIGAVDEDPTFGGSVEAGDHPQGGGFSATGRTEEGQEFARLDFKTDMIQSPEDGGLPRFGGGVREAF